MNTLAELYVCSQAFPAYYAIQLFEHLKPRLSELWFDILDRLSSAYLGT